MSATVNSSEVAHVEQLEQRILEVRQTKQEQA